jgi:hypothetical protein
MIQENLSIENVKGINDFLDSIKKENCVRFEFIKILISLNFEDDVLVEKTEILQKSVSYVIESDDIKVINFLANVLEFLAVKYNRMLYDKNLEVISTPY